MQRALRRWALWLTLASAAWATILLFADGVTFSLFGLLIRSHHPQRIFFISAAAFVVFTLAGGRIDWATVTPRVHRAMVVAPATRTPLALALAAATLYVGLAYNTNSAGASDSYGYVSQAHLWAAGAVKTKQPWVARVPWPHAAESFAPLGYVPRDDPRDGPVIVPAYSPGFPMLMAAAEVTAGRRAVFAVVPLLGALLVLATYGIGCRVASPTSGLIGAWLVATSPAILMLLIQPMSDLPTATFWAIAFYFLLRGTVRSQLLAGVAAAIAVLIRPNLAFGALMMVLWRAARALTAAPSERRVEWRLTVALAVGGVPSVLAIAAINNSLYGSPVRSGYGDLGMYFALEHFWSNAARYFRWFIETQTPVALAGVLALAWPFRQIWPEAARTRMRSSVVLVAAFVAAVWVMYFYYVVFDAWWYQRFLLASWPFIMIGVGAVAVWVGQRSRLAGALAVASVVIFMGIHGVRIARERSALDLWRGERHYPIVGRLVRQVTDPRSVVISMQHSGSVRFYGGRVTLRYDWIDAGSIDSIVAWLGERGIHVYLVVDEWELNEVKRRFAGQHAIERLKTPILTYQGEAPTFVYDLSGSPDVGPPRVFRDTYGSFQLEGPVPLPDLGL